MNSNFDYKLYSYSDKCITIIIIFLLQKNYINFNYSFYRNYWYFL